MTVVSMSYLLEAGVHFGHQKRRWNPKMKEFIYTSRDDIYIIDLQKTVKQIEEAYAELKKIASNGGTVLYVGTKKQAMEAMEENAKRTNMFFVNERWLGGTLTNFRTIRSRIKRLEEIEKMENEGIICGYPTLINWDKTDTEKVTAFIEVRVTPQRGQGFEKLAERITNYPEVKSIYLMSGAFDFAIFLEGKTLKEVSMFVSTKLSTLEAVAGTATHFVLKKYKDHGMILIDKEPTNRMKVTP